MHSEAPRERIQMMLWGNKGIDLPNTPDVLSTKLARFNCSRGPAIFFDIRMVTLALSTQNYDATSKSRSKYKRDPQLDQVKVLPLYP